MEHTGDWRQARRRDRRWYWGYWLVILLMLLPGLWAISQMDGWRATARADPPCVGNEVLFPEAAGADPTVLLSVLPLTRHYTVWEYSGRNTTVYAELDVLRFGPLELDCLAEPLWREMAEELSDMEKEPVADSRFDQAVLLTGRGLQGLLICRGNLVLKQFAYDLNGDLRDYLDDFAAVLDRYG